MNASMCRIGLFAEENGLFRKRVAQLRMILREHSQNVLADANDPFSISALSWAAWMEGKKIVFAPNLQPEKLKKMASSENLIILRGNEMYPGKSSEENSNTFFESFTEPESEKIIAEFHTSGSTGKPILLQKTSRQLFEEGRFLAELFEIQKSHVLMTGVPARHLYGFLFSVMIPSISGSLLVWEQPLHAQTISQLSNEYHVDFFVSTPVQLRALTRLSTLHRFEYIFSSGAPLDSKTRSALEKKEQMILEIFGSTETGGIATRKNNETLWTPFQSVEIASEHNLLQVRSQFLERPNTFYTTQDRVEIVDGKFRHLGRADDIVKIGGKRISKTELKNAFLSHPLVEDVAIGVLEEEHTRLHAFIVLRSDLSQNDLRSHLLGHFDSSTIPRIHFVDTLPRTSLGKVSRSELKAMIQKISKDFEIQKRVLEKDTAFIDAFVSEDCKYFEGHFDGHEILPGVAQILLIQKEITGFWPECETLVRIERIKFRKPIGPRSVLNIRMQRAEHDSGKDVEFTIHVLGNICSSGRLVYKK